MVEIQLVSIIFLIACIVTILIWIFIYKWVCKNKEKVPGRFFEYIFFLFLFFASYYLTWASSFRGAKALFRLSLMASFLISAIFSGYLHYVKKIYN